MRYSSRALLVACSMASGMAIAQTATITFEGKVSDQTCSVSVDGKEGDLTVKLPNVHVNNFASSQTAGTTPFDVKITGCSPASVEEEKYKLTFESTDPTTGGALKNAATNGAGNVAVQLTKDAAGSQAINLNNANERVIVLTLPENATEVSHPMAAQYIKVDSGATVTAGAVRAQVKYTLDYL